MEARQELDGVYGRSGRMAVRNRLLDGLPVIERWLDLAGVATSLLEGGDGPPIVLLHGQGGFAAMWGRVMPQLVRSHRVVAPDLPGLGESRVRTGTLDAAAAVAWLGDLIAQTSAEPPTIVGHSLGGTIAARFAIEHGDRVRRIVLVDSARDRGVQPLLLPRTSKQSLATLPAGVLEGLQLFLSPLFTQPRRTSPSASLARFGRRPGNSSHPNVRRIRCHKPRSSQPLHRLR